MIRLCSSVVFVAGVSLMPMAAQAHINGHKQCTAQIGDLLPAPDFKTALPGLKTQTAQSAPVDQYSTPEEIRAAASASPTLVFSMPWYGPYPDRTSPDTYEQPVTTPAYDVENQRFSITDGALRAHFATQQGVDQYGTFAVRYNASFVATGTAMIANSWGDSFERKTYKGEAYQIFDHWAADPPPNMPKTGIHSGDPDERARACGSDCAIGKRPLMVHMPIGRDHAWERKQNLDRPVHKPMQFINMSPAEARANDKALKRVVVATPKAPYYVTQTENAPIKGLPRHSETIVHTLHADIHCIIVTDRDDRIQGVYQTTYNKTAYGPLGHQVQSGHEASGAHSKTSVIDRYMPADCASDTVRDSPALTAQCQAIRAQLQKTYDTVMD
ncbi:hypothetical protein [uncultured Algimonas sp.]|uniref:hypothetical protein n=1 Tax=uncultured Algimonas sp. TaxID=1547920 RepID=UPI00260BF0FA|nr:hypothetical protein [uncultured Algimonas sp.]